MKTDILLLLQGHPWQEQIEYHGCIDSTNTRAKELAKNGAPEGTVVIADQQTAGRGRLGRSFHSPAGSGLYLSLILRPGCAPAQLMHLTCAVAVAACDAIKAATGTRPGIKWINDLVLGHKKLGGILTELSISPDGLVDYVIVGIGINCGQTDFPEELRPIACSLAMAGLDADRPRLAAQLIIALEKMSRELLPKKDAIMDRYRQDCVTLGQEVTVIQGNAQRRGKALSIDDDGALVVAFEDGQVKAVNSGEVSVRGLFGYA